MNCMKYDVTLKIKRTVHKVSPCWVNYAPFHITTHSCVLCIACPLPWTNRITENHRKADAAIEQHIIYKPLSRFHSNAGFIMLTFAFFISRLRNRHCIRLFQFANLVMFIARVAEKFSFLQTLAAIIALKIL